MYLKFIAAYAIVVGLLCVAAGLQEWWLWRSSQRARDRMRIIARDLGQWGGSDPAIKKWYEGLMQPDVPTSSCCGEADAYWADEIHVRDGKTYAVVTDDRPDGPLGRPHIDVGTEVEVPPNKLKWDKGNPVGHNIVFLSRQMYVFCFVQGGGA
jgi:hypothetical protein